MFSLSRWPSQFNAVSRERSEGENQTVSALMEVKACGVTMGKPTASVERSGRGEAGPLLRPPQSLPVGSRGGQGRLPGGQTARLRSWRPVSGPTGSPHVSPDRTGGGSTQTSALTAHTVGPPACPRAICRLLPSPSDVLEPVGCLAPAQLLAAHVGLGSPAAQTPRGATPRGRRRWARRANGVGGMALLGHGASPSTSSEVQHLVALSGLSWRAARWQSLLETEDQGR